MKKILLAVVAVAMIFATSCQKEDAVTTPDNLVTFEMGCNLMSEADFDALAKAETPDLKVLPTSVDLVVPPVGNQGGEGSCVAWGTTYAGRSTSYQNTNGGAYNFGVNIFSPEYVYNQIKVSTCAGGAYTSDGLDLLVNQGVCTWNSMPYTDVDCDDMPNATQLAEAANYKISSYSAVALTVADLKAQLAAGKILVVAGNVYNDYMNIGYNQVITTAKGRPLGGHCYACVGYDDAKDAFKFMNSWGTSWATNGFSWIDYDIMYKYWREAWIINE